MIYTSAYITRRYIRHNLGDNCSVKNDGTANPPGQTMNHEHSKGNQGKAWYFISAGWCLPYLPLHLLSLTYTSSSHPYLRIMYSYLHSPTYSLVFTYIPLCNPIHLPLQSASFIPPYFRGHALVSGPTTRQATGPGLGGGPMELTKRHLAQIGASWLVMEEWDQQHTMGSISNYYVYYIIYVYRCKILMISAYHDLSQENMTNIY